MKNFVKYYNFFAILFVLCATVTIGCRCSASNQTTDPLAGWQKAYKEEPNQVIEKDIKNLSKNFNQKEKDRPRSLVIIKTGQGNI